MSVYTITYGESSIPFVGMDGTMSEASKVDAGFTADELFNACDKFVEDGIECDVYDIAVSAFGDNEELQYDPETQAYILVARKAAKVLGELDDQDQLHEELNGVEYEREMVMRGRIVNRLARYAVCFGNVDQESDLRNNRGKIVAFEHVPITNKILKKLPKYFGKKAEGLLAECNNYYDPKECHIGWHGDGERKIVIGLRSGPVDFPLHYQYYLQGQKQGDQVTIDLSDGDLYAMSAKAVGKDWKRKKVYTLRHAAGYRYS